MGQYLTTADDFQIFQEAVAHWQKRLGLLDCHIYTRHKNRYPENHFSSRICAIILNIKNSRKVG